jgi:hypothetical protein
MITLILHRRHVVQRGAALLSVVEQLDLFKQALPGFLPRTVPMIHMLGLDLWKKLSIAALSRQLPTRHIDDSMPWSSRR